MIKTKKIYIDGKWALTSVYLDVKNKYNDTVIAKVCVPDHAMVEKAIDSAWLARDTMASLTARERGGILDRTSALIERDAEELALLITREAGKGILFSRGEVARSTETFKFCADEARRVCGELIPFDAAATGAGRFGFFKRYPKGVIGAITPFNFPLNLVAHKVGPAIAAGCPIVLKPASATPLTAIKLVELLLEAGLPENAIQLLVGPGATVGRAMVVSDKIAMITFTGSPAVGLEIRKNAGMKQVTLELGSNSAAIIHKDADIAMAVPKCVTGAFANSGQVCISVQRVYIHETRYDEFRDAFVSAAQSTAVGDPEDTATLVGPMIHEKEAKRIESWIDEAQNQGANITLGGKRNGNTIPPTIIENCDDRMRVVEDEAFAPVVCLMKYKTLDEAFYRVNKSKYGLQAGVFTTDINTAFKAIDALEVGGVMVNEMPMFRVDQMPYGGTKLSGNGREGARFAVEEMTEIKTVMINLNPL